MLFCFKPAEPAVPTAGRFYIWSKVGWLQDTGNIWLQMDANDAPFMCFFKKCFPNETLFWCILLFAQYGRRELDSLVARCKQVSSKVPQFGPNLVDIPAVYF